MCERQQHGGEYEGASHKDESSCTPLSSHSYLHIPLVAGVAGRRAHDSHGVLVVVDTSVPFELYRFRIKSSFPLLVY